MPTVTTQVATTPNDAAALPQLVKELSAGAEQYGGAGAGDDALRHELIIKARAIVQALETPRETMIKHCWAQPGALGMLTAGVECGLWARMAKDGDAPQKVADLAAELKVDEELLSRLMRHLGAMGYLFETGVDEYRPTNFAKALSLDMMSGGYQSMLAATSAGQIQFGEWARERGWKTPSDANDTSFHRAYAAKMNFFEWQHHRGYGPSFNSHMAGYRQGRPPWCTFFPVAERLLPGVGADAALLVDVGGSTGHDLDEFRRHFPDAPGRLVLQDLPAVIAQVPAELDARIERMAHDFLTEQPVRGARAYYMHSTLHDWPDSIAATILGRLKDAMEPGFSKILINENVIPTRDAYWEATALDTVMMTMFASKERTEADWHRLIEKTVGLKIVKIWSKGKGVESIIEVELP